MDSNVLVTFCTSRRNCKHTYFSFNTKGISKTDQWLFRECASVLSRSELKIYSWVYFTFETPARRIGPFERCRTTSRNWWPPPTTWTTRRQLAALLGRANLTGLVLGCIEAKFCKKICVWKLSPRSTQCTPLHSSAISKFAKNLLIFTIFSIKKSKIENSEKSSNFFDKILTIF